MKKLSKKLLRYSKDAYNDNSQMAGKRITGGKPSLRGSRMEHASATVYRDDAKQKITIAFRGTDDPRDWNDNLNIAPTNFEGLKAHGGFVNHLNKLYDDISDELNDYPGYEYDLTGHSLAGAVAQLFAYKYYKESGRTPDNFVSFGSPRAIFGNPDDYNKVINHIRVAREKDSASEFPPPWDTPFGGYRHTGEAYIANEDGIENKGKGFEEDKTLPYLQNMVLETAKLWVLNQLLYYGAVYAMADKVPSNVLPVDKWKSFIEEQLFSLREKQTTVQYGFEDIRFDGDMLDGEDIYNYFQGKIVELDRLALKDPRSFEAFDRDLIAKLTADYDLEGQDLGNYIRDADEMLNRMIENEGFIGVQKLKDSVGKAKLIDNAFAGIGFLGKLNMAKDLIGTVSDTINFHNLDKYDESLSKLAEDTDSSLEQEEEEELTEEPEPEPTSSSANFKESTSMPQSSPSNSSTEMDIDYSSIDLNDILGLVEMKEGDEMAFIVIN